MGTRTALERSSQSDDDISTAYPGLLFGIGCFGWNIFTFVNDFHKMPQIIANFDTLNRRAALLGSYNENYTNGIRGKKPGQRLNLDITPDGAVEFGSSAYGYCYGL